MRKSLKSPRLRRARYVLLVLIVLGRDFRPSITSVDRRGPRISPPLSSHDIFLLYICVQAAAKKGFVGIHSSGFKDFLLKPELLRAIQDCGFEHPSEVQVRAR